MFKNCHVTCSGGFVTTTDIANESKFYVPEQCLMCIFGGSCGFSFIKLTNYFVATWQYHYALYVLPIFISLNITIHFAVSWYQSCFYSVSSVSYLFKVSELAITWLNYCFVLPKTEYRKFACAKVSPLKTPTKLGNCTINWLLWPNKQLIHY